AAGRPPRSAAPARARTLGAAESAARRRSRGAPSPRAPSAAGGTGRGGGEGRGRAPGPRANGLRQLSARGRVHSAPPGTVPAPDSAPAPRAPPLPERRGERAGPGPAGERDWSPGALKESDGGARRSHPRPAASRLPRRRASLIARLAGDFLGRCDSGRTPLCDPPEGRPARTWGLTVRAEGSSRPGARELSASAPQELRRQDRRGPRRGGQREAPTSRKPSLPFCPSLRQARPVALARAAPLPGVPTARASPPRALPGCGQVQPPEPAPRPHPPPTPSRAAAAKTRGSAVELPSPLGPGRALNAPAKTHGVESPEEP
ncbi:hypothetical protein GH733_016672, partial [Mirounga leonina]